MEVKKKMCKGRNKAYGFEGCGEHRYLERYGLCRDCFKEWVYSTGEGGEYLRKMVIPQAKKKVKTDWNKKKKAFKDSDKTLPQLQKELQKEINTIAREIDKGHGCTSSGRTIAEGEKADGGHVISVGSNATIRYHLFNIYLQSVHDNRDKYGNPIEYLERLGELFGQEHKEKILALRKHPPIKLSKKDIREKISVARGIVKWLKLQDREFTREERISLRVRFNKKLGIYQENALKKTQKTFR